MRYTLLKFLTMQIIKTFLITLFSLLVLVTVATAQIEVRLATPCATQHVEVPLILKNLQNITELQLKMIFDNQLLNYDSSLYQNESFSLGGSNNYKIHTQQSGDTLMVSWSAYYGVNVEEALLLSFRFREQGNGQAHFQWLEDESFFKDINGLNIDATYVVDAPLSVPNNTAVNIDFNQFTTGCRDESENGGCKAQVEATITGGQAPYAYQWRDKLHQTDAIAIGLCQDPVALVIKDNGGCYYAASFDPIIHTAARYNIKASPEEEVFITKPNVDFSVELEEGQIETYAWDFGDKSTSSLENPSHVYHKIGSYQISLKTETIDGCDTTVVLSGYEVKELNFCIPNVFTPNGDNINDKWVFKIVGETDGNGASTERTGFKETKQCSGTDLEMDTYFKSSHLVVLSRNGKKVFECNDCREHWDGGGVPDGVYFHMFEWEGEYSKGKEQGNVTILGSGN